MIENVNNEQVPDISHEAEQRLRNDVQRDAARTRESGSYDNVEHVQQDGAEAEDQTGAQRHHDAF